MRCEEARQWLGAWRDGELSPTEGQAIADHVAQCPACAEEERALRRLGAGLLKLRATAPEGLRACLHDALAREALGGARRAARPTDAQGAWSRAAVGRSLAATAVLAACAGWLAASVWLSDAPGRAALHRDIVSAHMRALVADATVQIAAADPHVVKPWFAGRVDFAPSIRDLSQDGFPLAGARLDIVDGRRVGVAVYKRRLHTISVFMWPADRDSASAAAPRAALARGFNLVTWSKDGVVYCAASDLNAAELSQLPQLLL